MNEEDVCSVCMDSFKFPKMLPCQHTFCVTCLSEYLEEFEDKTNFICPLCRESCFVPERGFGDFPPNYFSSTKKVEHLCQGCKLVSVSKVCYTCYSFHCVKCYHVHSHSKKAEEIWIDHSGSIPLQMRLRFGEHMKTELVCRQLCKFSAELSIEENEQTSIVTMASSRNGVFVLISKSKNLLKYNKQGNMIEQIPLITADDASAILQTRSGQLLLIAHYSNRCVVCYADGSPNFNNFSFAKTPSFHPFGLSELLNGNIVISGPIHLCSKICNDTNCELMKCSPGILQIFSKDGRLLRQIIKDGCEYIMKFPSCVAASSRSETFAVCDRRRRQVMVFDYSGHIQGMYASPLQDTVFLLPENESILPYSICSTSDGNYVIADPRAECLHVLNPIGKYIGILRCDNLETLAHTSALCTDKDSNIWIGHHQEGTITILKPKCFKNVFKHFTSSFEPEILFPDAESFEGSVIDDD